VVVAALSMMRDSEIREISRGGLVDEFFGAPAVVSRKRKQDPGRPLEHWWITEPVARAIVVAEELALHPELVFADPGLPETADRFSASQKFIDHFVRHVNAHRQDTGLPEIPDDHIAPHQFRKTMSILVSNEPGAEIALGLQLKHAAVRALANRSTQGYAASDTRWARLPDSAIEVARFTRPHELYERHHAGETIGYGPGAEKPAPTDA
jgi:integrase